MSATAQSLKPKLKYTAILIDDDDLVHSIWEFQAASTDKNVLCFHTTEQFLEVADIVDPSSPIFIDVDLGNGLRGEAAAERIAQLGFKNIFLATGYDASTVTKPKCVAEIVGKVPKF